MCNMYTISCITLKKSNVYMHNHICVCSLECLDAYTLYIEHVHRYVLCILNNRRSWNTFQTSDAGTFPPTADSGLATRDHFSCCSSRPDHQCSSRHSVGRVRARPLFSPCKHWVVCVLFVIKLSRLTVRYESVVTSITLNQLSSRWSLSGVSIKFWESGASPS